MKFSFIRSIIFFSVSWLMVLSAQAASTVYTIDPTHTFVLWQINHMGFSTPSGKWPAQGTIDFDAAKPQDSKVNITVPMSDIISGVPKLDEHLRSKDFFDVEQFPTATFVSDKIIMTGKDTAKVHGILTLHGVSKPVVLDMKLNKSAPNPMTKKPALGFSGKTMIKRSDFGVSAYVPDLGDEIKLDIQAEASQNQ